MPTEKKTENMNNGFEDRLRESLAEQANQVEIDGAGPAAAAERASERAQRADLGRGLGVIAVVLGLGAMAYNQFGGDGDQMIAAEENTTTTAALDGESETASATESATADFAVDLVEGGDRYFGRFLTDEGQLIQLTTKPGMSWQELDGQTPPHVVQVSDRSGVLESNELPKDFPAINFAYHDGVLFSVSTSPIRSSSDQVVVSQSADNGRSWNSATINVGDVLEGEHIGVWQNTNIAASDAGVLVSVDTSYFIKFETLLPQYAYSPGRESETFFDMRPTDTGVEVRDWSEHNRFSEVTYAKCGYPEELEREPTGEEREATEECWSEIEELPEPNPIAQYTWEELGIQPIPRQNESKLFYSPDGVSFEEVAGPVAGSSPYIMSNDTGFLVQANERLGEPEGLDRYEEEDWRPRWFASSDGRSWGEIAPPPGDCGISMGGGKAFISQSCDSTQRTYRSLDGGRSWKPIAPIPSNTPDGYQSYSSIYAGDLGLVAVARTEPDYMLLEEAMMEASEQDLSPEEMGKIERAFMEDNDTRVDFYFSADGSTWSAVQSPIEAASDNAWVNDVLVGTNEIVITFGIESADLGYTSKTVFLTPS
jgi:hypothetical protein